MNEFLWLLVGIAVASLLWVLYISFFPAEVGSMRARVREKLRGWGTAITGLPGKGLAWIKAKLSR